MNGVNRARRPSEGGERKKKASKEQKQRRKSEQKTEKKKARYVSLQLCVAVVFLFNWV